MYEIRLVMLLILNVCIFRYGVMSRCWNLNPDFRPPFENLRKRMDTYIREEVCSDKTIWIKDHDDYNYRNKHLYSQTKKRFEKIGLKIISLFVWLSRSKARICLLQTCRILARTFRSLCPILVILG